MAEMLENRKKAQALVGKTCPRMVFLADRLFQPMQERESVYWVREFKIILSCDPAPCDASNSSNTQAMKISKTVNR